MSVNRNVSFLNILEQTCIRTKSICQKEGIDVSGYTTHKQHVAGSTDISMLLSFKSLMDLLFQSQTLWLWPHFLRLLQICKLLFSAACCHGVAWCQWLGVLCRAVWDGAGIAWFRQFEELLAQTLVQSALMQYAAWLNNCSKPSQSWAAIL